MQYLLVIYAWLYFSLFCHEMGHFVFAKLGGMSPYLVQVGGGYKIAKFKVFNARFQFGIIPFGGLTHAYYLNFNNIKAKVIFLSLGGAFANFVLLLFLLISLRITNDLKLLVLIIIELLSLAFTLIPMEGQVYGQTQPNDGQQIILALFKDYNQIFKNLFEEYRKALLKYETDERKLPNTFLGNDIRILNLFLRAQNELDQSNIDNSIQLFLEVLKYARITDTEKAFIFDYLACIVAINGHKQYLNDADYWSKEAIELASYSKTLKGTRGAILIELGRYDEGKQLLLPLTEPENDTIDIAISSCYIAKAEYFLGNIEEVEGWLRKAKEIGVSPQVLERIEREINCFV